MNRLNNSFGRIAVRFFAGLVVFRSFACFRSFLVKPSGLLAILILLVIMGVGREQSRRNGPRKPTTRSNTSAARRMLPRRCRCIYSIGDPKVRMWTCFWLTLSGRALRLPMQSISTSLSKPISSRSFFRTALRTIPSTAVWSRYLVYRCWTPLLSDRSTREVWIHGPAEDVGRAG